MIKQGLSILILGISFLVSTTAGAAGDRVIASSGTNKVTLIELFSSESCSSCPPADLWVSSLESRKDLWSKFVPVVFHVDYWNHLNWKDELSSSKMTARQVAVSKTWAHPSVYTPAVVLSGKEWRGWRNSKLESQLIFDSSEISLKILQNEKGQLSVLASGLKSSRKYTVHLAKLGFGLSSKVTDGENSGKTLGHSFVVLDWHNQNLSPDLNVAAFDFGPTKKIAKKYAVVAWIEESNQPIALQATGAYL